MNQYPTNLTDNQWQVIENFLDVQVRKRKYSLRSIVNAIGYLLKTGCQWRMLPKDFPLAIVVHEANIHDSVGALQVFENMRFKFS